MSTTAGHRGGSTNTSPASWADLPDDLLGMVRLRVASTGDRVRLAAVCRRWHAVPLLLLSPSGRSGEKHLCGPDGGDRVLRVPSKVLNKRIVGSHQGGWIAATDGDHTLVIVNLFSGAEVALSAKLSRIPDNPYPSFQQNDLRKIVFSDHPTSSNGCTLAGLRGDQFTIALCRVGCSDDGAWSEWSEHGRYEEWISDIAFCNGELYGLTRCSEMLIKFEIGTKEDGTPVVTTIHKIAIRRSDGPRIDDIMCSSYIFELNGKISMAARNRWLPNSEPFFRVFKLADVKDNGFSKHRWKLTSLGNHALFLGPALSKAVHVPVGECHGMEKNHIYYSYCTWSKEHEFPDDGLYSDNERWGPHVLQGRTKHRRWRENDRILHNG